MRNYLLEIQSPLSRHHYLASREFLCFEVFRDEDFADMLGVGLIDPDGLEINILGNSMVNFVSEPNLYNCVVASRKKDAKRFQQWICKEVLPFVRKTEEYSTEEEIREVQLARALISASEAIREAEERRRLAHAEAVRRGTVYEILRKSMI